MLNMSYVNIQAVEAFRNDELTFLKARRPTNNFHQLATQVLFKASLYGWSPSRLRFPSSTEVEFKTFDLFFMSIYVYFSILMSIP